MSVRIVVKVADCTNPACANSGSVAETFRTFDVEAPEMEALLRRLHPLRSERHSPESCRDAWVVGAEVASKETP